MTDLPGALPASCRKHTSYLSLSQSSLASSHHDAVSDFSTSPGNYSPSYSSCLSHRLTPLTFESNVSLDTLSLYPPSVTESPMNSPNSINFSLSSEIGDNNQEATHFYNSLRRPTEIAPPSFDNSNPLSRVSNTGRDYSPDFYPNSLLLSQPDGKNNWTLSLDPTISHPSPATVSESLESESVSLLSSRASDDAIARTFPSISSTPRLNASLSLQPSQDDMAKFNPSSDVSLIVSSTSSVQQRPQGGGTSSVSFNTRNADLYFPHGLNSHCQPPLEDNVPDPQQPSRSNKLIKKSKNIFGRFKKLFSPKGTISEDLPAHTAQSPKSSFIAPVSERRPLPSYQRYRLAKSTMSLTPSFGQSFSPEVASLADKVDEKYTYEYHARPKTLKEIKSQRRFSLPLAFVGSSSSRVTPSTKRNVTTSFSRSQSRPMSIYIATQNEKLA